MRMHSIARFAAVLTILFTVPAITPSRALGQSDPAAISGLTANRSPFTAEESARIRTFGEHWLRRLTREGASPSEVDDARRRLLDPLRGRGQSELFLSEYGDVILPGLLSAADGTDSLPHVASNALIIVSRLGTERALDALVDRSSLRTTPADHIRLSAARGARELLRQASLDRVTLRKRQQVARRLRDAANAERDPFILRHHLHAIFHCDGEGVDNETRSELLGHLGGALASVADRAGTSVLLLDATTPVVFEILREFLRLDSTAQAAAARALTPGIVRLLDAYAQHAWDAPHNAAGEDRGRFARQVARIERCLQTMLPFARPNQSIPPTNLESAWAQNDQARFRREVDQWKQATR